VIHRLSHPTNLAGAGEGVEGLVHQVGEFGGAVVLDPREDGGAGGGQAGRDEVGHVNGLLILSGDKQTAHQSNVTGPPTRFLEPLTVEAIGAGGKPAGGIRVSYALHGAAFFEGTDGLVDPDNRLV
jgi:hypothetical protein